MSNELMHKAIEGKKVLSNQVISNPTFLVSDSPLKWQFTLLKYNEYDNRLHKPLEQLEKAHFHSFFEIHIPIEGEMEYCIEDMSVLVKAGEFLLIFPRAVHVAKDYSPAFKKYSFAFQVSTHIQQLDLYRLFGEQTYYLGKQFSHMLEPLQDVLQNSNATEHDDFFNSHLMRAQYDVFYLSLLENLSHVVHKTDESSKQEIRMEINDQMIYEKVVAYLQEHIAEHVMISDVARLLLMSERQLNRRLVRFKGCSFSKIQESVKCQRARELLASNLSLSEISEMIGMGNEYTFNRFFKRVEGMPPARFRNTLRSSNYK